MLNIVIYLINSEIKYFEAEIKKATFFLNRGKLTSSQKFTNDLWLTSCYACKFELEQLKEDIKSLKMEYYAMAIRGKIETNEDGSQWAKLYTFLKFIVKGEENRGYQEKPILLKFDKSKIDITKLGAGFLVVHKSNISVPKIYEVKEENGKKLYPFIYVREIESFTPEPVFESEEMPNG